MALIMLVQQTIWNADSWNIEKGGERDIQHGDYPLNLSTLKNITMSLMLLKEKNKYKIGAGQNEKH